VLASQEKLGAASQYVVCTLTEVSGLIVEQSVPDDLLHPYIAAGLTIIRA